MIGVIEIVILVKIIMIVRIEGMERSKNEYQCKDRKSEVK